MSLDAEQIMEQGVVVGTRNPTGDHILLDCRFELPYGRAQLCYVPSIIFRCYSFNLALWLTNETKDVKFRLPSSVVREKIRK